MPLCVFLAGFSWRITYRNLPFSRPLIRVRLRRAMTRKSAVSSFDTAHGNSNFSLATYGNPHGRAPSGPSLFRAVLPFKAPDGRTAGALQAAPRIGKALSLIDQQSALPKEACVREESVPPPRGLVSCFGQCPTKSLTSLSHFFDNRPWINERLREASDCVREPFCL